MYKLKFFSLFLLLSASVFAQRFGYVDTDYVLESLPAYKNAQSKLELQAKNWAKEIENHQQELERMTLDFENEKILLTEEKIEEKEKEIAEKKQEIAKLQEQHYGPHGDMITSRKNLVKPIQDQIFNAVTKVAKKRKYGFIFDKANGDLTMLYSDPKYDISEEVLKTLAPDLKTSKTKRRSDYANEKKNKSTTNINLKQ